MSVNESGDVLELGPKKLSAALPCKVWIYESFEKYPMQSKREDARMIKQTYDDPLKLCCDSIW